MLCWRIRVREEEKSPPESKHPTKFPVQARKRARERKRAWNIGRQKEDNLLWHFRVNTTCVRTVLHRCDFTGGDLHYYSWTKSTSTSTVCRVRDICSNTVLYSMLRFVCFYNIKAGLTLPVAVNVKKRLITQLDISRAPLSSCCLHAFPALHTWRSLCLKAQVCVTYISKYNSMHPGITLPYLYVLL